MFCGLDGISELILDTIKIPSEKKIKEVFNTKETKSSTETIKPLDSEKVDKVRRPTFEMPEKDHKKLKTICTFEGVNVGDKLYMIVKEWLDQREISFD